MNRTHEKTVFAPSVAVVVGVALVAFVLCSAGPGASTTPPAPSEAGGATRAPSYRELRDARRGDNARMYDTTSSDLEQRYEDVLGGIDASDALAAQQARRAYDGAPPTVPHAVTQRTLDCVACHVDGAAVGRKIAPRMNHEMRASCAQCHVPSGGARQDGPAPLLIDNDFDGLGKNRHGP